MENKCFIIGKGKSLAGFDLSRLEDEYTLCLNHSFFAIPNPSGLCFMDKGFYKEYKDIIDNFTGDIYTISATGHPKGKPNNGLSILSGIYAIAEALEKFDKVYLLGYDMDYEEEGYPYFTDFPNGHTKEKWEEKKDFYTYYSDPSFLSIRLAIFDREFQKYDDRVFNCNKKSKVRTFKYKDIDEVL